MQIFPDELCVRFGVITALVKRFSAERRSLGKTTLMKLVYLLQETKQVDLRYNFSLYTYGPFSVQVLDDLDFLATIKELNIAYHGDGGYRITPISGDSREHGHGIFRASAAKYQGEIDAIIADFRDRTAKNLELISTIIFVAKAEKHAQKTENQLVQMVHEIKPHFSVDEIAKEMNVLEQLGYIN